LQRQRLASLVSSGPTFSTWMRTEIAPPGSLEAY